MNTATPERPTDEQFKPPACDGCTDGSNPIYKFELTLTSRGWASTSQTLWLCANCQYTLAFEKGFLSGE